MPLLWEAAAAAAAAAVAIAEVGSGALKGTFLTTDEGGKGAAAAAAAADTVLEGFPKRDPRPPRIGAMLCACNCCKLEILSMCLVSVAALVFEPVA
mmetsp:Transcript_19726/g.36554  ORF Transcript_19726/g.36554 Transcript_19726/m.36554 type:complete len:96 (+) Transcript_19726:259-546(+)